jgi:hypothetical protein
MRRLDEKRFLVRFPPGKKIKDLVSFPSINLKKKGFLCLLWTGMMIFLLTLRWRKYGSE